MNAYYVNDDAEEYCTLPDPTSSQQLAMVGYLLVQAPMDGTGYGYQIPIDELDDEDVEEFKARERRHEGRTFLRYVRETPDYAINKFEQQSSGPERGWDNDLYGELDAFREFAAEQARSTYRNEDGSWDEAKMAPVIAASIDLDEYYEYMGRWARGDHVRLVLDEQAVANYTEVTDEVVHEMHDTLPDNFLVNGESVLSPDMVVTTSDDDGGGDGTEPDATSGGEDDKALFPRN